MSRDRLVGSVFCFVSDIRGVVFRIEEVGRRW